MDSNSRPFLGPSAADMHRRPTSPPTERWLDSVHGSTFKSTWHPYQKHIKVAQRLNDCLQQSLEEIVKFKDPAGNVTDISVTIQNGRQCFEDGLLQMMEFYDIHEKVDLYYTYTDSDLVNDHFDIRILRTNGLGEIDYPQQQQQREDQIPNDWENMHDAPERLLWTAHLTKAQISGRQGLLIPVTIVTGLLEEGQEIVYMKLPNGEVQAWNLLWNTKIHKDCRLGQGWYRYCRKERL
ncbi:B3 domain-containing protein [Sesbania bispinosa]|nr:B3 domain-containing protein [Sesbania bispinosa]